MKLLCAGAAKGLVEAWRESFTASTGVTVEPTYGAVGAMKDALLGGNPCDVMIVTDAMVAALQREGHLLRGSEAALGRVRTGVAVRDGDPMPDIRDGDALRAALLAASAIYFPDAQKSTAGIHFAKVLARLGIADEVADRGHDFPNGATAMRALAADTGTRPIGCTQVTEILYTSGLSLVGVLPEGFGLATVYGAAVSTTSNEPEAAQRFIAALTGAATRSLRDQAGFEAA